VILSTIRRMHHKRQERCRGKSITDVAGHGFTIPNLYAFTTRIDFGSRALHAAVVGAPAPNENKMSDGWSVARPLPVCSAGLSQRT
jgi:hypothetical protein